MMMTAKLNAQFLLEMLIDLLATTVISIIALNVSYIRLIARRSTVQKYGQLTRKVLMVVALNGGRLRVVIQPAIQNAFIYFGPTVWSNFYEGNVAQEYAYFFVLCIRKC